MTRVRVVDWGPVAIAILVLALAPLLFTDYYLSAVLTKRSGSASPR